MLLSRVGGVSFVLVTEMAQIKSTSLNTKQGGASFGFSAEDARWRRRGLARGSRSNRVPARHTQM